MDKLYLEAVVGAVDTQHQQSGGRWVSSQAVVDLMVQRHGWPAPGCWVALGYSSSQKLIQTDFWGRCRLLDGGRELLGRPRATPHPLTGGEIFQILSAVEQISGVSHRSADGFTVTRLLHGRHEWPLSTCWANLEFCVDEGYLGRHETRFFLARRGFQILNRERRGGVDSRNNL